MGLIKVDWPRYAGHMLNNSPLWHIEWIRKRTWFGYEFRFVTGHMDQERFYVWVRKND